MSYQVFDFEMVDGDSFVVPEGHRLVKLLTGNDMDAAYCLVPCEIDEDELEDELRLTFRRRFGNGIAYLGYEDVSYVLESL